MSRLRPRSHQDFQRIQCIGDQDSGSVKIQGVGHIIRIFKPAHKHRKWENTTWSRTAHTAYSRANKDGVRVGSVVSCTHKHSSRGGTIHLPQQFGTCERGDMPMPNQPAMHTRIEQLPLPLAAAKQISAVLPSPRPKTRKQILTF